MQGHTHTTQQRGAKVRGIVVIGGHGWVHAHMRARLEKFGPIHFCIANSKMYGPEIWGQIPTQISGRLSSLGYKGRRLFE